MCHYHQGQFKTHFLHVVASMGPIVSVVTLDMVGKTHSSKADQSAKPGNGMVNEQCMSVAISWTINYNGTGLV